MGGAVSSGESNDELVDNLMSGEYIKSPLVETVFRAVDRAFYFTKPFKHNAYKDLAWKDGNLHISAPCIYSEVMENLNLKPGMSFLNIGAGTGYLSTMIGLVLGRYGTNHGIELHGNVVDYARAKLKSFVRSSPSIDIFDFCEPEFVIGNCMDLIPTEQRYDRIYCGAACPNEEIQAITDLLKVGGLCIIPVNDSLVQIVRTTDTIVEMKPLLPVSFATLVPSWVGNDPSKKCVILPRWNPPKLGELCRAEIREILRRTIAPAPETKALDIGGGEEGRKKRRKRRAERRRASRLLVLQRRRNGEAREGRSNNGFVAFAYSMGDNTTTTSSDDDSNHTRRRRLNRFIGSRGRASSVENLATTGSREKRSSSETNSGNPETTDSTQAASSAKVARKEGSNPPSSSHINHSRRTRSDPASDLASTVLGNLSASSFINLDQPRRRARTESILARIREIIQNRQSEREALRVAQAQRDLQMQREVEEAIRDPVPGDNEGVPMADLLEVDQINDEIDHECVWTSESSSSSSSSSSTSSSEDTDCLESLQDQGIEIANPNAEEERRPAGRPLAFQLPPRRHRLISLEDSSDEDMDADLPIQLTPRDRRDPSVNNAEKEIEAIEEEQNQPSVVLHPFSVGMMKKIDSLSLPAPIKKYLNFQRDFS